VGSRGVGVELGRHASGEWFSARFLFLAEKARDFPV
jgi:hypothetical protein